MNEILLPVRSVRSSMGSGMCLFGLWSQHQSTWHKVSTCICWTSKTTQWWNQLIFVLTVPVCWQYHNNQLFPNSWKKSLTNTVARVVLIYISLFKDFFRIRIPFVGQSLTGLNVFWNLFPLEFHKLKTLKINYSACLKATAWNFAKWFPFQISSRKRMLPKPI